MSTQEQGQGSERDHFVVVVQFKKVTFEEAKTGSIGRQVATVTGARVGSRHVGDLLTFSVTGETVAKARERAITMLGVVDDETPATNLKHNAMRDPEENR